ncbi:uncharacterized protein TRIREDRAFT_121239 [Trichoderma reesei QM6a]|uniref:Predicted protein n=2 Tax=Hypocrea jecorina TaxID=51453 RepID=G0RGB4_HYPJQ|nr:uncharacterized protein TRIREDRAFT_121239 [Trichoderma reesei QM6a]EGR50015.1 predicted protein [Trichoderma reesei QM6a]
MLQRSASPSSALPRFLLSLSASSSPSQQQLRGPANNADACWRLESASPPDSACQSASQDIELVVINTWDHPSAASPRVSKHKRASVSLPALSPSAPPEARKSAGKAFGLTSRGSSASLDTLADLTASPLGRGMTQTERQKKANQVWRGYWSWGQTTTWGHREQKIKMASPSSLTKQQKFKGGVWAVAFAAVIMVGTLTGAQLKSDKQKEQAIQEFRQVTPSEQIAMLQKQRAILVDQRTALQKKLDVFKERVRERHQAQETSKKP